MYQRGMNNRARESLFAGRNQKTDNYNNGPIHAEKARNLLEEQNDEQINHLSLQIDTLKQLTTNIHTEVQSQNKFLDGMGQDFDSTDGLLGGTLKKLGQMMDQGGGRHMYYLIGFVIFVFILLYFVMKGY